MKPEVSDIKSNYFFAPHSALSIFPSLLYPNLNVLENLLSSPYLDSSIIHSHYS